MQVEINYAAVVLAMVSSLVIGSIWYAMPVFGRRWVKLAKIDMKKERSTAAPIIKTTIMSLFTAYVLAHMTFLAHQFFGNSFLYDALSTAYWAWLGLVAARFITHDGFEGRPGMLTLITLGNEFVTFMAMGLVIGLLGYS